MGDVGEFFADPLNFPQWLQPAATAFRPRIGGFVNSSRLFSSLRPSVPVAGLMCRVWVVEGGEVGCQVTATRCHVGVSS